VTAVAGTSTALATVRLIHPAPAVTVVALSAALGWILSAQAGLQPGWRLALTTLAVAGSQVLTGALNDWADRERDLLAQPSKPIPSGAAAPRTALVVAALGAALQIAASVALGPAPFVLGAIAAGSAVAYNLWLSRTPLSVIPYLVSFGILPVWVAAGVGVDLGRVALAPVLVGPFAAAAHLANTLRDFEGDARIGSRNLAQVLGRTAAFRVAWALAVAVGLGAGIGLALGGGASAPISAGLGLAGLAAVAQGWAGAHRLWAGMLVAAVCWTVAWALASG
jgi:4-hydroxybenzoate polyprenyltransferase